MRGGVHVMSSRHHCCAKVMMDSEFALEDVGAAHARMQKSLHVGKIALVMS